MKKYYLAYGSNLNLEQMKLRCKYAKKVGSYTLKDYRLVYKGNNVGYLTIEKFTGSEVPLGVFEVSFLDTLALDKYEGYPSFYKKEYFNIVLNGKKAKAFIYIMNDNFDYKLPLKRYVQICEKGYENFNFNNEILNKAYNDTLMILLENRKNEVKLTLKP